MKRPTIKNSVDEFTSRAVHGDCVKLAEGLGKEAKPKLIIADPPYNIGMPYDAYDDNKSYEDYMAWTAQWMGAAVSILDKHGSLWIFCPDEWVSEIDVMARKEFKLYKRRHVVWAFTFGQKAQQNFTKSHCHLLWMTKSKTRYTFNVDAVAVPSARQLVYNDKRAKAGGKPPDATWMLLGTQLEPFMTPDRDTWLQARICGTFKERIKESPNQIPLPLMERIVLATSNPGDLIVDMFAGTGSSGQAAVRNKRRWIGFDISGNCVAAANARIKKG